MYDRYINDILKSKKKNNNNKKQNFNGSGITNNGHYL